ncbi:MULTISPECIES: response regulator transcription factor [Priestia]|uniref:response regulator transcription factor n=1 Tax=Priestia TaxID=2800373 RepID=UPI001ADA72B4|nr:MULTISPECIES: response regulator transcription factor [Priestia]QTL52731.1 response regulator transcription factor [Priestia aryabhattai]USL45323.1 response regulator transcription factor [Priestia megaterium]
MINILIVDDHPAVAQGTKFILEQNGKVKAHIINDPFEVLENISENEYDIVILDLHMPGLNGIDLAKLINQKSKAKIIIYTGYDVENYFNLLIESGVIGFVSKASSANGLINAVNGALNDEAVIPVTLLRQLRRTSLKIQGDQMNIDVTINEEEQTILIEIEKGSTNREISQKLHVSQRTIEHRLTSIFQKLNVNSRVQAVLKAKELGLIPSNKTINL